MAITLHAEKAALLRESIKRYFTEHLDQDIGDLKAYFETRVVDLEGSCHEPEFQYWKPRK